jgi:hypothetical protein
VAKRPPEGPEDVALPVRRMVWPTYPLPTAPGRVNNQFTDPVLVYTHWQSGAKMEIPAKV